jgi:hypothetical protein
MATSFPCFAAYNVIEWVMVMKPLEITDMDVKRARRIERSWAPKDLSEQQIEYVLRAIAQGNAQGRQQGLELAKGSE